MSGDCLFVGIFPGGTVYADRTREEHGDYARLAFLPHRTLALEWDKNASRVSADVRQRIADHAASIQNRRGESFRVSTAGQTVKLGD